MKTIRWIFFDIGSTLVDEEEAYKHRIRDMIEGTSVTLDQFWDSVTRSPVVRSWRIPDACRWVEN